MKTLNTFLALVISIAAFSQGQIINQYNWDTQVAYENSPTPIIKAFGPASDSLKSVYGEQFLYHDGLYYSVSSWADYFLWFTQKYWYRFTLSPQLYKFYYESGDNFNMMDYIFQFQKNDNFPTMIVDYGDLKRSFIFDQDLFDRRNEKLEKRSKVAYSNTATPQSKVPFGKYGSGTSFSNNNSVGSGSTSSKGTVSQGKTTGSGQSSAGFSSKKEQ